MSIPKKPRLLTGQRKELISALLDRFIPRALPGRKHPAPKA